MLSIVIACAATSAIVGGVAWFIAMQKIATLQKAADLRFQVIERSLMNAGLGTFVTDMRTMTLHSTAAASQLLGLKPEPCEMSVDQWVETLHPDDRQSALQCAAEAIKVGKPYTQDYRVQLADGSIRWLRAHALPEHNEDGKTEDRCSELRCAHR